MRRSVLLFVTALAISTTHQAHAQPATIEIRGYQYLWTAESGDQPRPAGYLATPVAAHDTGDDGIVTTRAISGLTNQDPVPHSFTGTRVGCAACAATFSLSLSGLQSPSAAALAEANAAIAEDVRLHGTPIRYAISCNVHSFMKGKMLVND